MPATAQLQTGQEFDSVRPILTELNIIYAQQSEIRETLGAKGVPLDTVKLLGNLLSAASTEEFDNLCGTAVRVASDKYGIAAVSLNELVSGLKTLGALEEEAQYIRRISNGLGFNPQAMNMLTNIIRQNPGDDGKGVLDELVAYAVDYGVELEGIQGIKVGANEPLSVLPDIDIRKDTPQGLIKHKDIAIDLVLAAIATYTVMSLLT